MDVKSQPDGDLYGLGHNTHPLGNGSLQRAFGIRKNPVSRTDTAPRLEHGTSSGSAIKHDTHHMVRGKRTKRTR